MPSSSEKIMLLNKLLAMGSGAGRTVYADAARGIEAALSECAQKDISLSEFAQNIMPVYDVDAAIEVVDVSDSPLGPLFAIPLISAAAKRISGHKRSILVISGISPDKTLKGRKSRRIREEEMESAENYIMRYAAAMPNLEIIFI